MKAKVIPDIVYKNLSWLVDKDKRIIGATHKGYYYDLEGIYECPDLHEKYHNKVKEIKE